MKKYFCDRCDVDCTEDSTEGEEYNFEIDGVCYLLCPSCIDDASRFMQFKVLKKNKKEGKENEQSETINVIPDNPIIE